MNEGNPEENNKEVIWNLEMEPRLTPEKVKELAVRWFDDMRDRALYKMEDPKKLVERLRSGVTVIKGFAGKYANFEAAVITGFGANYYKDWVDAVPQDLEAIATTLENITNEFEEKVEKLEKTASEPWTEDMEPALTPEEVKILATQQYEAIRDLPGRKRGMATSIGFSIEYLREYYLKDRDRFTKQRLGKEMLKVPYGEDSEIFSLWKKAVPADLKAIADILEKKQGEHRLEEEAKKS